MKERPILFSAPMVRALLDGSKTQTRRVAPIADLNIKPHSDDLVTWGVSFTKPIKGVLGSHSGGKFSDLQARSIIASQFNPHGQPGDRLWVRETFYCDNRFYPNGPSDTSVWREVDGKRIPLSIEEKRADMLESMFYRADGEPEWEAPEGPTPWRPSIHMPRWASRITLEITAVRVERLQDITDADAIAEGICRGRDGLWNGAPHAIKGTPRAFHTAIGAFDDLWTHINGPDSWAKNPWVWVIEFKRVTP